MITRALLRFSVLAVALVMFHWLTPNLHLDRLLPVQPCAFEDGPGPCYWDASVRGNGQGQSFWIDSEGGVHDAR